MYIADRYSSRIRKVTVATGIIATIAGSGTSSYSGDNGPATSAALYEPFGVAIDASGTIIITICCIICFKIFYALVVFLFLIIVNLYSHTKSRQRVHR